MARKTPIISTADQAPETPETTTAAISRLTPAQRLVVQMVAEWRTPEEIRDAIPHAFESGEITQRWLYAVSSQAERPGYIRPIIEEFRRQYLASIEHVPCCHARYRMEQLQRIISRTEDDRIRLAAIHEAFEQSGDKARLESMGGLVETPSDDDTEAAHATLVEVIERQVRSVQMPLPPGLQSARPTAQQGADGGRTGEGDHG